MHHANPLTVKINIEALLTYQPDNVQHIITTIFGQPPGESLKIKDLRTLIAPADPSTC